MRSLVLLLTTCSCLVKCLPPPHPDVLAVRREEEHLPPILRSPALRNPNLLQVLPLTSLLHKGEKLVYAREASNVSRKEIYKILTHAGLIPRKTYPPVTEESKLNQISYSFNDEFSDQDYFEQSLYPSQDLLHYL